MQLNPDGCALEGYANIDCCTDIDWHHIISFSMARGNPIVRAILKSNPPELMAWVCATHNRQRWADGRKARAILLRKRNKETQGKTKETVDSLPWKIPKHCDTFEAMIS